MTPDPYVASGGVGDPGSWNRYAYTRGDPTDRFDPQGLQDTVGCNTMQAICDLDNGAGGSVSAADDPTRGGGGFGDGYGQALQQGYVPGMPADMWAALQQYNQMVLATLGLVRTPPVVAPPTVGGALSATLGRVLGLVWGLVLTPTPVSRNSSFPKAPFDPLKEITDPQKGWQWNDNEQKCWTDCPEGSKRSTTTVHQDDGVKCGEGQHWDYVDCNGDSWKIWPDGTMTPGYHRGPRR